MSSDSKKGVHEVIHFVQTSFPIAGLASLSNRLSPTDDGMLGEGDGFTWATRAVAEAGGTWIELTLHTTRELTFNPTMIVWLGELDLLDDRQAHTWRQTVLRAPTANQQGLGGNDLPAGYLYDHSQRLETIFYVPPDSLAWSPHRFYEWTIRDVMEYRPTPRYGIGLIPTIPHPAFTFAPGTHAFRFWVRQLSLDTTPSTWDAQNRLIEAVTPLLDPQPTLIPDAPGWDTMARGTLQDVQHEACWIEAKGKTGLRAYVKGSSAVGRDQQRGFELMTQLDVLLPLLYWRQQTGETGADAVIERLLDAVRAYEIIEPHAYLPNHYPFDPSDTFMDTWYFYENALIKLPLVAHLTDDADLRRRFFGALEGGKRLVERTHHLLPLFADANGWQPRGSLLNAGVSGMYAAGCVLAYQLSGDARWQESAVDALRAIHQLPPHLLTHEPQQLSFAAAAANAVGLWDEARDFVNLSLRMGYWAKDPAAPFYDPRGMFQACASLSYPAYKENVEVLWAWSELLAQDWARDRLPGTLMAAFANLQRCHNYAFFDAFLPASMRRGPCPHIPYEDLATAEFTHTATLGKELYGAGEVFWSALLFSPPASLRDLPADLLTFSLDVPCLRLARPSETARRWLVYNPRSTSVELSSQSLLLEPKSVQVVEGE